jgi:arylsulfatase A-like enzyme
MSTPLRAAFLALLSTIPVWLLAADRPNILWLTSEDHGPQMGCYGDTLARTPNIDALAAKGMIFTQVWSNNPVCAPAYTTFSSGIYANSSGGIHMRSMVPMPSGAKLYSEFLRGAGYYCCNNGKEDYNLPKTERTWDNSSTKAHWKNRPEGKPFFASFNSTKSHEGQIRKRPHKQITDPAAVRVPAYHPDTPEVRQDWAQYYDKVSEADGDAGVRLRELAEANLADDTIVFYYADHGSAMPRSKRWPSDSGLRVPMIVYFPPKWQHLAPKEYQAGGKSGRFVSFVDLAPTLLSIAGVKPPVWMQGHAFAGQFQTEGPSYLFGARNRMDERQDLVRSVTDGRFVYVRNYLPHLSQAQHVSYQFQTPTTRIWRELFDAGKTNPAQSIFWQVPKAPEELYDLSTDPDEVINLAQKLEHRKHLETLRSVLDRHLEQIRDVCFLPEGEMHARAAGSSPYDMARDPSKYPFQRIHAAARLASNLEPAAIPELRRLAADPDVGIRYWGTIGFLMRGAAAVRGDRSLLQKALKDSSPYVQVVAAEALGLYGSPADLEGSLAVLRGLISPSTNGVFVSMSALSAVEALGQKAAALHPLVRTIDAKAGAPDPRFSLYVPRLVENIVGAAPAPGDNRGDRKKQ